jgi:DNA-binding response OmpR family regulator
MTTVLIMDDSEIVLETVRATLEAGGASVHSAMNLAEMETQLRTCRPDVVVLDVQMPEMFGDDLASVLRHVRSMSVPILLFSDMDEAALAKRVRDAAIEGYVAKKDGVGALLARISELST